MSLLLCGLGMFVAMAATGSAAAASLLAASEPPQVRLSATPSRIELTPARAAAVPESDGRTVYLTIDGLSSSLPPGASYDVFLGPANGAMPLRDGPGYAGTLNFFDVSAGPDGAPRSVSFDVTGVLAELRRSGTNALAVTLIPDNAPQPNSAPGVGRIRLMSQ